MPPQEEEEQQLGQAVVSETQTEFTPTASTVTPPKQHPHYTQQYACDGSGGEQMLSAAQVKSPVKKSGQGPKAPKGRLDEESQTESLVDSD